MSKRLPISGYKFIKTFNRNKYGQNKDHSCLMNVEIYTTEKVLNNNYFNFPAL